MKTSPLRRQAFIDILRLSPALGLLASAVVAVAAPTLPTIPSTIFKITNAPYNALGDGVKDNTTNIQSAINAASTAGGGIVEITPGVFLSGPFTLKSKINLQIDSGAILRMLPLSSYPGGTVNPASFITGSSLGDLEISGFGAIDGQGAPWWPYANTNGANRPNMVNFSTCSRILIQDTTFSNCPSQHIVIKGKAGNVTIQGITVSAPSSSDPVTPGHNTDAIDLAETNALIQNCNIHVGDDNVAVGSSASPSADIIITNCTFGVGHGVSIGSFTSGGVSNMTVVNCTFSGTDQGIRIKSDRDRGGTVQNISYFNIGMTNVQYPILIYCTYTNANAPYDSLNSITPTIAASYPSVSTNNDKTPIYRNITISNVTATAQSGRMAGLIWGLPELSISNLTMNKVTITGSKTFGIYDAKGVQFIDSQIITPSGVTNISFYDAQITFSNSLPSAIPISLDGASTNSIGNTLLFYNAPAQLNNTNALASSPSVTLGGSTLSIGNALKLEAASVINFVLGTNASTLAVTGNLTADGTFNVAAGNGFTNGSYTLLTYGNNLTWTPPALGSAPAGYNFAFDTNTAHQVKLTVTMPPSTVPTNLLFQITNSQFLLTWPSDHIGWRLELQTNAANIGLSTNWFAVPNSQLTNQIFVPIAPTNASVFMRLIYP